ncbi:MAG: hypothetical protein K0R84_23 [Clostridia bacterium]|nr:hypothetical protein [Clostridia bacterium]
MKTLDMIKNAHRQTSEAVNLIASEAWFPPDAKLPYVTDIIHRYCFDEKMGTLSQSLPKFPGRDKLNELEERCNQELRSLMKVNYSSLKPVSGLNMMLSTISCMTKKGEVIMSIPPEYGGHSATKYIAERVGLKHYFLPFESNNFKIDIKALEQELTKTKVKIVYIDMMNVTFPLNLRELRGTLGNETIICYDASHVLGLIMGGQFQSPFEEGADVVIGTTHKTFPGPHKGVFLTNKRLYFMLYDLMYDMYISHHHVADIAALALMLDKGGAFFEGFACKVISNANTLGNKLKKSGIRVYEKDGKFSACHQLWVDTSERNAVDIASKLAEYGVVVNTISLPMSTSKGLRIGVQEVTYRGFGEREMSTLSEIIAEIIIKGGLLPQQEEKLKELKMKLYRSELAGVETLIDNLKDMYDL